MKILLPLLLTLLVACNPQKDLEENETDRYICKNITQLPALASYRPTDFVEVDYDSSHCGYLPLNKKNYWVYLDSIFNSNGQFLNTAIDTVRFLRTYKTPDGLIWWGAANPSSYTLKGFPKYVYATDSTMFSTGYSFGAMPGIKWYYSIASDSTSEDCRYTDHSTSCFAKRLSATVSVPAGNFTKCMFFKKDDVYGVYSIDVFYKPGVGILKSRFYLNQPQQLSHRIATLIAYHLE